MAARTWLLKSQYGHFALQNGQWTYMAKGGGSRSSSGPSRTVDDEDAGKLLSLIVGAGPAPARGPAQDRPLLLLLCRVGRDAAICDCIVICPVKNTPRRAGEMPRRGG